MADYSVGDISISLSTGTWVPSKRWRPFGGEVVASKRRHRFNARRLATRLIRAWHRDGHHVGRFSHAAVARMLGGR